MYKYIIFDIDGTILDTEKAVLSSLQKLVREELNKSLSFDDLTFALGIPGDVTLKKLGITDVASGNQKWNLYLKEYFSDVKVFDSVEDTLKKLKDQGVYMGIVTSKTHEEFKNDFTPFGLNDYFNLVVCADDTEKHKPDPEPVLKFIELSGADKSKTIYIGDTEYDAECAAGAGVDFALALWGAKTSECIDAKYILKNPQDILNSYDDTIKYWDNVFGQAPQYDPKKEIDVQEIENGISWLSEGTESAIDFGCGNGRVMLRCLDKGMKYVNGIDISSNAVEKGKSIIERFNYNDRADITCGGTEKLDLIEDNSFDGAVLFNILDNLTPEDSMDVVKNIHRIVKSGGKILLKFNPYITDKQTQEYGLKEISEGFYKEDTGLYLLNLTNKIIEKNISPFFNIEKYEEIQFKQYDMINRMYYLRNK